MRFTSCPKCGSKITPTQSISGADSRFWYHCTNVDCGSMIDNFQPLTHQYNFLKDSHKFKGTFGGFGSAKSTAVIEDVIKHILITPGAYVGVVGFTVKQIKRNFKKDFDEIMPKRFMRLTSGEKQPGYNVQEMKYTLRNGSIIELITADDTQKLRGLNATKIVVLEASNVSFETIQVLKSRLRNMNAAIQRVDEKGNPLFKIDEKTGEEIPDIEVEWINMVLESNPENNWLAQEFLLKSEWVQFYGKSYRKYSYKTNEINDQYSSHITATDANPYLPPNYLEDNTKGKPDHEVQRFYYGSFEFSENMVHPEFIDCVIDDYPIDFNDPDIFVLIGYDYGRPYLPY